MKINNTNQNPKQIPTKDPSTTKRKQCSTIPIPKIRITTEYEMQISKFHKLRKKEKNNAPEDQESERTWEVEWENRWEERTWGSRDGTER